MIFINIVCKEVYLKIFFEDNMKKSENEVCFIGNAIVDILSKVSDETLNKLEVEKGSMQLVDEKLSDKILTYIKLQVLD